MNNMKSFSTAKILLGLLAITALGACGGSSDEPAATAAEEPSLDARYAEVLAAAKDASDRSMELRHQWTTVPLLIEQAESAAGEGDLARAIDLADEGLKQAEQSIKQAEQQSKMWPAAVPQ
jgi:ABC-type phosphate transport system substrate-binding protein